MLLQEVEEIVSQCVVVEQVDKDLFKEEVTVEIITLMEEISMIEVEIMVETLVEMIEVDMEIQMVEISIEMIEDHQEEEETLVEIE